MEALIFVLEIVGTVAFAVSGAMTGLKKSMDIFGVIILGLVTAVGGGVIRDVVLGAIPPATFQDPAYASVAAVTAAAVFFPWVRGLLFKNRSVYEKIMLVMDSLGLGVFTVIGVRAAMEQMPEAGLFLQVFVGVVTGVGGGVMRDVLAGNTPYIFIKHIYASASIAGAILCAALWTAAGAWAAIFAGAFLVVGIRLLAAKYKWSLPRADIEL